MWDVITHHQRMQCRLLATVWLLVFGIWFVGCGTYALAANGEQVGPVVKYLYNLSDFNGPKTINAGVLALDSEHDEHYLVSGDTVQVFGASGMEIYAFECPGESGSVYHLAVLPDGSLLLVVRTNQGMKLVKTDYRGEGATMFTLYGDATIADFTPNWVLRHQNQLYFANTTTMKMVVTALDGAVTQVHDLAALAGIENAARDRHEIGGLVIAPDGSIVFSLPVTAKVYRISADLKTVESFGKRGSSGGKFGVPSGVAVDRKGNIIVADKLRYAVLIFGADLSFKTEFSSFAPLKRGGLISPTSIVVDANDRLYVSQQRNRGVSVFQLQGL